MSHPAPHTSLSTPARLLCYLGPPSAILLTSIRSPQAALLSPLAFLPTACFYRKWRELYATNPSRRGEPEPLLWIYAGTGTIGLGLSALIQLASSYGLATLLFGTGQTRRDFLTEIVRSTTNGLTAAQLSRRAALASSWQNWLFNFVFAFGMAGLVEETLKYLPIAYARRRGTAEARRRRDRAYIDYAVAGALSFGVVENVASVVAARDEAWQKLALTLFERVVVGSFGHLLGGVLTALRAVRRDSNEDGDRLSWWRVIGPSVLLHGAFDFVALSASAVEGNVGWIHPTGRVNMAVMFGLITAVVGTAAWLVRAEWVMLEKRDGRPE